MNFLDPKDFKVGIEPVSLIGMGNTRETSI
jgi:hypothetical protein